MFVHVTFDRILSKLARPLLPTAWPDLVTPDILQPSTLYQPPEWMSCVRGRRLLGLSLMLLMVGSVLHEHRAPLWMWIGPVAHCLLLCPLTVWAGRRWPSSVTDVRVAYLCQFLGGAWIALMGFNVLPSVLISLTLGMNALPVCGRDRLWRVPLLQCAGVLAGVAVYGLQWRPEPSLWVVVCSLPLMLFLPWMMMVVSLKTVQQLRDRHDELQHLSRHDGLSGLLNRAHWEEQVRAAFADGLRQGRAAVVVMADLDHFKHVNDRHGHAAGDEVIRRFSQTLKRLLRASDVCGRYGGEEFGILMLDTTEAEAIRLLQRVRLSLHHTPMLESEPPVTASFGVAALEAQFASVDAWLRQADDRLYQAKRLGRDRIV